MRLRAAATLLGVFVLAGCSSALQGTGSTSGSRTGSIPSPSPSPSTAGPTSIKYPRTPAVTSIGDPATADLCAAIGLAPFAGFGYTPSYKAVQFPPGCAILLTNGTRVINVNIGGATPRAPFTDPKRTSRVESGLTVFVYPYVPADNECTRFIQASKIDIQIFVYGRPPLIDPVRFCGLADAAAKAEAAAVAGGAVPRVATADVSLSRLDFCAALRAADLAGVDRASDPGTTIEPDTLNTGCAFTTSTYQLFLDFKITSDAVAKDATPRTVGGHTIYAMNDNTSVRCRFYSNQGRTSDGKIEGVYLLPDTSRSSAEGCASAPTLLARFLDAAGLP